MPARTHRTAIVGTGGIAAALRASAFTGHPVHYGQTTPGNPSCRRADLAEVGR